MKQHTKTNQQDIVAAILMIGDAMSDTPGASSTLVALETLNCIEDNTGLCTKALQRAILQSDQEWPCPAGQQ